MTVASSEPSFCGNRPPVVDAARLAHMATIEENWDSYGAHPPTEIALAALRDRLCLYPNAEGGWGIDFEDANGQTVSFDIDAEGLLSEVGVLSAPNIDFSWERSLRPTSGTSSDPPIDASLGQL